MILRFFQQGVNEFLILKDLSVETKNLGATPLKFFSQVRGFLSKSVQSLPI